MAPGMSDEAVTPGGKPAKSGRDGKSAKEPKDGKRSREDTAGGDGKNSALLRQMAADLAAVSTNLHRLQTDVDTLKEATEPSPASGAERSKKKAKGAGAIASPSSISAALQAALADSPEIAIALVVPSLANAEDENSGIPFICAPDQSSLGAVDTAQVAKLGYAFSSLPKVALVRMLLQNGEQTAAQLGAGAGLTTGSLYHHLRELVHAEVIYQSSRNRYALTDLGRRTVLVLLALQV